MVYNINHNFTTFTISNNIQEHIKVH
jgi:hypothetical protein